MNGGKMMLQHEGGFVWSLLYRSDTEMPTRIRKIGNSTGLLLSKSLLEQLHVQKGDFVDLAVENGVLTLKPVRKDQREGWAAAAMAIAAAGEDGLAWPEFGNEAL